MVQHVVTKPTPPFRAASGALEIHQVPVWEDNLVWVAICTRTREAAVIDGPEAQPVLDYCQQHGIQLTTLLNTHTHMDHVGINHDLKKRGRLEPLWVIGPARKRSEVPGINEGVDEGSRVRIGACEGRVLLTEGHVDGHVSYVFEDVLFCGDTMFAGGCGYLFDGPPEKMFASLSRLIELDPDTRVCCAHEYTQDNLRFAWSVEPDNAALAARIREVWALRAEGRSTVPSTIAVEAATNPFVRQHSLTLRASVARAFPDRDLSGEVEVFAATRALKDRKDYRAKGDEGLPLAR